MDDNINCEKKQNDELNKLKKQLDDSFKKIDELEQENKELKSKVKDLKKEVNRVNNLQNYYKKGYILLTDDFNKTVDEKVQKEVNKKITIIRHDYDLKITKLNQEVFNLTNRLNLNSKNSSLPGSKNPIGVRVIVKGINRLPIYNSRKKSNKKIGGQPNHQKYDLPSFSNEEITETIEYKYDKCLYCNSENLELISVKNRDEYDIEINLIKKRHKFYQYKCLDCGKIIETKIPVTLHATNQYGANLKALAISLTNTGYVSIKRTKELISCFTNNCVNMSEGYIAKLQKKVQKNLSSFQNELKKKIINSEVIHWDDTCATIGKNKFGCFRVYTNKLYACFTAHNSKSSVTVDEDNILKNLNEQVYVVHDHYKHNYNPKYKFKNVECNAHNLRNLEGIFQITNHLWAINLKRLLEETLFKRNEYIRENKNSFSKEEIQAFDSKYDELLQIGFKEYEEMAKTQPYPKEINLLKVLKKYKEEETLWVRDFKIPFSNNLAERSFRIIKTKLKVSGMFKNENSIKMFANIMSYTETCNRHSINKFESIKKLVNGEPYTFNELDKLKPAA